MAINWYWKSKVGEIHYLDKTNHQHWKLDLYTGNMCFCIIYHYKQVNEETNETERLYNFFGWFDDIKHFKRVVKKGNNWLEELPLGNHKLRKIRFMISNTKHVSPYTLNEIVRIARYLVKIGYKVELY